MMPPGTSPTSGATGRKAGLNGLELLRPYSEPAGTLVGGLPTKLLAGWVREYRLAVESANLLLLKAFAVFALAIAIARLPGQVSGSFVITEQSTPFRSTTADHIRLG